MRQPICPARDHGTCSFEPHFCVFCGTKLEVPLRTFFVLYGDHEECFMCRAENATHAVEQCANFIGGVNNIHGVFRGVQDDSWLLGDFPSGSVFLPLR